LEQLDQIAGRIGDEDLLAARSTHDVATERYVGGAEAVDLCG
jgi:hypothetical protein